MKQKLLSLFISILSALLCICLNVPSAIAHGNSKTGEASIVLPLREVQYARASYTVSANEPGMLHLEVTLVDDKLRGNVYAYIVNGKGETVSQLSSATASIKETYVRDIDLSSLPDGDYALLIGPSDKPASILFSKEENAVLIK